MPEAPVEPVAARVEGMRSPTGFERDRPTLSWRASGGDPGDRQTAYRVRVATDPGRLPADPDVWDSGRIEDGSMRATYRGPPLESGTTYHWTVRVRDAAGRWSRWAAPSAFETGLDDEDWDADWIRGSDPTPGRARFDRLRTEFDLSAPVERARAYLAASHRAELSIDGETVDRGPAHAPPGEAYYLVADATDLLSEGTNAIGLCHAWYGAGKGRPEGEPGVLLQVEIDLADGSERTIATGGDWRARPAEWEPAPDRSGDAAEPVERIDGRRHPVGWDEPGFDDSGWTRVGTIGTHPTEPWTRVRPRERGVERGRRTPASIERVDEGTHLADFGEVIVGVPRIRFSGGNRGRRVAIRAGYRLEDGRVSTTRGVQGTDLRYEYVQRNGEQVFEPLLDYGFRYVEISGAGESLAPGDVWVETAHAAVPEESGAAFESSDDTLDAVWDLARRSALFGAADHHVDTPTREKAQFLGDAFLIAWARACAFDEHALSRRALREFRHSAERHWAGEGRLNAVYPTGSGARDIPEYSLFYPEWVFRHYRRSGDRRFLAAVFPLLRSVGEYVERNVDPETGLVHRIAGGDRDPYRHGIVDWPPEMRYGFDLGVREGAATTINALAVAALRRIATLADALDRPEDGAWATGRADAIGAAMRERLTRADGVFVDGLHPDGTASEHASQHANAFALVAGVAGEDERIAEHLIERGMAMGPMTVTWLLRALAEADRTGAIVDLLTDGEEDGYAAILDAGGTFTWETWHCRDPELDRGARWNRSESHPWGSAVLAVMQSALLGVEPIEPGGGRVRIAAPSTLDAVSGRVPTSRGPVEVEWKREAGALSGTVSLPWNATAELRLPGIDHVEIDGRAVVDGTTPAGASVVETDPLRVALESGTFEVHIDAR